MRARHLAALSAFAAARSAKAMNARSISTPRPAFSTASARAAKQPANSQTFGQIGQSRARVLARVALYLASRGVPETICEAADVRTASLRSRDWAGARECALFPFRDRDGAPVAFQARAGVMGYGFQ